jgi:hypothetical protein
LADVSSPTGRADGKMDARPHLLALLGNGTVGGNATHCIQCERPQTVRIEKVLQRV